MRKTMAEMKEIAYDLLCDIDLAFYEPKNMTLDQDTWEEEVHDGSGYAVRSGASKGVIIPDNEDFVIKVPFNGYYMDYDEYCDRNGEIDEDEFYEMEYENRFQTFEGVYYRGINNVEWDYCSLESKFYALAEEDGVGEFFLETRYLFDFSGYPIYIQQKAEGTAADIDYCKYSNNKLRQKAYKHYHRLQDISNHQEHSNLSALLRFESIWLFSLLKSVSLKKIINFGKFILSYEITDMHNENYGYVKLANGEIRPVILDYSGFSS